jgi:hypothetical protein
LLAGVFLALPYGRAIATEPAAPGRIEAGSPGSATVGPASKIGAAESSGGPRPEGRSGVEVDPRAQKEGGDREEIERRKRMFILMLQIFRAPK